MTPHIVILGGGPAGYVAASYASSLGARITLVDPKPLGGICLNHGCIPTKVLVDSCSLFEKMKRASSYGVRIDAEVSADWPGMRKRASETISLLGLGIDRLMSDRNVTHVKAMGRLLDGKRVAIEDGGIIEGDAVLVCTGSAPVWPAGYDKDPARIATSDNLLDWETLPKSLLIVGAGLVSCEYAFILNSLGVDVTILVRGDRVMSFLDSDISAIVLREMRKRKIAIKTLNEVERLAVTEDGVAAYKSGELLASAERALIAVGRSPNSRGIGLEDAGVDVGLSGEILTNDVLETTAPGIYAVGDVNGRAGLAHTASAQAKVAVDHALGHAHVPLDETIIPLAVFTMPEIGTVGLSEQAALARGYAVACGRFDMRALGRAHALGEIAGMAKVVSDKLTHRLLGVHVIGAHAAEIVHEGAVLLRLGATTHAITSTVHAHPTLSEAVMEAAEDALGQAVHKPLNKRTIGHACAVS